MIGADIHFILLHSAALNHIREIKPYSQEINNKHQQEQSMNCIYNQSLPR